MGDLSLLAWPEDDDRFVQLYILSRSDWDSLIEELRCRTDPTAVAWFHDECEARVRALTRRLTDAGLSVPTYVEICDKAWEGQHAALARDERPQADDESKEERTTTHRAGFKEDLGGILAESMRDAVVNLYLRGLGDDEISTALNLPEDWPAKIVARARLNRHAREVVRRHLDGGSLGQISSHTGVPTATVGRILRLIGERPNGAAQRVDARDRARTINKLRQKGLSYKEIARRVGCSIDDVKNALRRDRRHRYSDRGSAA